MLSLWHHLSSLHGPAGGWGTHGERTEQTPFLLSDYFINFLSSTCIFANVVSTYYWFRFCAISIFYVCVCACACVCVFAPLSMTRALLFHLEPYVKPSQWEHTWAARNSQSQHKGGTTGMDEWKSTTHESSKREKGRSTDRILSDKMHHVALNLCQSFLTEIFARLTRSTSEDLVVSNGDSSEGAGMWWKRCVGDGGIDPTPLLWCKCKEFSWNYWEFPTFSTDKWELVWNIKK